MARTFIIIDPDPIVSLDLEGLLVSQFTDAEVVSFRTADELACILTLMSARATLFVRGGGFAQQEEVANLVRAAVEGGCSVVSIGAHYGTDIPFQVVDMPFTNESILEIIVTPLLAGCETNPH